MKKSLVWLILLLVAALTLFTACSADEILNDALEYLAEEDGTDNEAEEDAEAYEEKTLQEADNEQTAADTDIDPNGQYSDPDSVALYIHTYGHLPSNYMTKHEAEGEGWDSKAGNLWDVAYGYSIGGDKFGNREGLLPSAEGRQYYECDVNYEGGYRGGERIIFSNDGLIFYSADHYKNFIQLY